MTRIWRKAPSTVVSSGHDGYVVQTYRNIYDGDGKKISTTKEAYCVYRKKDRVVRVGTKSARRWKRRRQRMRRASGETDGSEGTGGSETAVGDAAAGELRIPLCTVGENDAVIRAFCTNPQACKTFSYVFRQKLSEAFVEKKGREVYNKEG